jgi:hypothetical protein
MKTAFTVECPDPAQLDLARIALAAARRDILGLVSDAATQIDLKLRWEADTFGESLYHSGPQGGEVRMGIIPPLAIHFSVDIRRRRVRILRYQALPSTGIKS